MGSWVTYGLGLGERGPARLRRPDQRRHRPDRRQGALEHRLPAHASTRGCSAGPSGDPILYVSNPKGMDRDDPPPHASTPSASSTSTSSSEFGDPETLTRISQYELAFRMQMSVPEVMDIRQEPETHPRRCTAPSPGAASFANNCLLARRLVERGVRYVQLFDWGWDCHGTGAGDDIVDGLPKKCQRGRPADRGPAQGPEAARAARRDPGHLGRRVRPDLDERGARRLEVPGPRPPPALLHDLDGRRRHQGGHHPRRHRRARLLRRREPGRPSTTSRPRSSTSWASTPGSSATPTRASSSGSSASRTAPRSAARSWREESRAALAERKELR